jgi:hypothetical protein
MGFKEEDIVSALRTTNGNAEAALQLLLGESNDDVIHQFIEDI